MSQNIPKKILTDDLLSTQKIQQSGADTGNQAKEVQPNNGASSVAPDTANAQLGSLIIDGQLMQTLSPEQREVKHWFISNGEKFEDFANHAHNPQHSSAQIAKEYMQEQLMKEENLPYAKLFLDRIDDIVKNNLPQYKDKFFAYKQQESQYKRGGIAYSGVQVIKIEKKGFFEKLLGSKTKVEAEQVEIKEPEKPAIPWLASNKVNKFLMDFLEVYKKEVGFDESKYPEKSQELLKAKDALLKKAIGKLSSLDIDIADHIKPVYSNFYKGNEAHYNEKNICLEDLYRLSDEGLIDKHVKVMKPVLEEIKTQRQSKAMDAFNQILDHMKEQPAYKKRYEKLEKITNDKRRDLAIAQLDGEFENKALKEFEKFGLENKEDLEYVRKQLQLGKEKLKKALSPETSRTQKSELEDLMKSKERVETSRKEKGDKREYSEISPKF